MPNPMKPAQTRDQAEAVGRMQRLANGESFHRVYQSYATLRTDAKALLAAQAPDKAAPCGEVATATLADRLARALAGMLDLFGGYETAENDAAISAMQAYGVDRWSMVADMGQGGLPRDFPAAIPSPDPGGSVGRGEAFARSILPDLIALNFNGWHTDLWPTPEKAIAEDYAAWKLAKKIASLPAPTEAGWRDIASAPKDGTRVLLTGGDCDRIAGGWHDGTDTTTGGPGWTDGSWNRMEDTYVFHPTHWMPLPASPSPAEGGER